MHGSGSRAAWLALAVAASALGAAAARGEGDGASAELRGSVAIGVEGVPLAAVAPLVVFLEPLDGTAPVSPPPPAVMHQHDARFSPPFLVVAAGQPLDMANDDAIYHNVFSYSRPNDFDLGLYPAGESRRLELRRAGVVKVYCSIHESMSATILVVPAPWHDTVAPSGRYAIAGVRPGRYRAVVWSEHLPSEAREIELRPGERARIDWVVGTPGDAGR